MTHCPYCGSGEIKREPTMAKASDATGALAYYRCQCRAVFSRLTNPIACDGSIPGSGKAIAKPAYASAGAEH